MRRSILGVYTGTLPRGPPWGYHLKFTHGGGHIDNNLTVGKVISAVVNHYFTMVRFHATRNYKYQVYMNLSLQLILKLVYITTLLLNNILQVIEYHLQHPNTAFSVVSLMGTIYIVIFLFQVICAPGCGAYRFKIWPNYC